MAKMIFVNLPVTDLPKSMGFYAALGFTNEPKFTDETAACMVVSDTIYVMLLTHPKWQTFTTRPIPDSGSSEVSLCLSCDDRAEVDRMTMAAGAHGGAVDINPPQDHGFMYGRSFTDPDGHVWEPMWMDPAMVEAGVHEEAAS